MEFNNFEKNIILRVLLLTVTLLAIAFLSGNSNHLLSLTGLIVLAGIQTHALIKSQKKLRETTMEFLKSLQEEDIRRTYPEQDEDPYYAGLYNEFNRIIRMIKTVRRQKEAEYQYFKNIFQHLNVGLIAARKDGKVQLMNLATKKLLNMDQVSDIQELGKKYPEVEEAVRSLKTGGHQLLQLKVKGNEVSIAVDALELSLEKETYKVISLQNIQHELEEKEMDAWQNLVRVLTHEIMNSVTPISSLASTTDTMVQDYLNRAEETAVVLSRQDMEDLDYSLKTIEKRSHGLIKFVNDFRSLTQTPEPKLEPVELRDLFNHLKILFKHDLEARGIQCLIEIAPGLPSLQADQGLIEQVLINLVKNAMEAFGEQQQERVIRISASADDNEHIILRVKDNGKGIEEEALKKIFIPFFTTKKQGSGIGLSLSKEIMRKHKGSLSVSSQLGEGTEFMLKF